MKITREGYILYFDEPCQDSENKILLMQAGGLSDSEERALLEHMETCEACKSLYLQYELIDDSIRDYLKAQHTQPPKEMPKKLKIMLSENSKQHFSVQLQEIGQSILFQQPEVCDLIRPWSEPKPLNCCAMMLNNSCTTLLKDPYIQEVGLSPDFVEDCKRFLLDLVDTPVNFFEVKNSKEAFDRALTVDPNNVMAVKSLGDYHYFKEDYQLFSELIKQLLGFNLTVHNELSATLYLCLYSIRKHDYQKALQHINKAETISNSFHINFIKFRYYLSLNYMSAAEENLLLIDNKIESDPSNLTSIHLLSKWFYDNHSFLIEKFRNHQKAIDFVDKYKNNVIEH